MTVKSRKPGQFKLISFVCSEDDNPSTWAYENTFYSRIDYEEIIGYYIGLKTGKFGNKYIQVVLYTINNCRDCDIISTKTLRDKYEQWLLNIKEESKTTHHCWQNPPLDMWLATKNEWVIKKSYKYAKQFNITVPETMSFIYEAIINCYTKGYVGNLNYVERAIVNTILMDFRYNKNYNTLQALSISLDDTIENSLVGQDSPASLAEAIGEEDKGYEDNEFEYVKEKLCKKLESYFSKREIEQIIASDGKRALLPLSLYRKLLRWREKHSKEEFECLK